MFDENLCFKCLAIGVPRAATVVDTYESRCQKPDLKRQLNQILL